MGNTSRIVSSYIRNQLTNSPAFDIFFQRLAEDTALCMPGSPTTIIGLRSAAKHTIEQWWSQAKRHAFRTWPYLLNSTSGIFLVTKTVKTARFVQCFSGGNRGEVSQIRIHGMQRIPSRNEELDLQIQGTQWFPLRNELDLDLYDSDGRSEYTIFMERDASQMFTLSDNTLKEAAQKLWK